MSRPKPARITIGNPRRSPFRQSNIGQFGGGPTGPLVAESGDVSTLYPFVLVASTEASTYIKDLAEATGGGVCDGTNDQVEILDAQDLAIASGRYLQFSRGNFNLSLASPIEIDVPWRGWSAQSISSYGGDMGTGAQTRITTLSITPTANLAHCFFASSVPLEAMKFRLLTAAFDVGYLIRNDSSPIRDCALWQQSAMIDTAWLWISGGEELYTPVLSNLRFDHPSGSRSEVPAILVANFAGADISHIKTTRFDAPTVTIASGTSFNIVSSIQHIFGSGGTPTVDYVVDDASADSRINCQSIYTDRPSDIAPSNNCAL